VEWVETTGRSVEEAKDAALDQLGVDEADAEFEVVADARSGLFGRLRQEARVRARVRPTTPPPKVDRRERRRRGGGGRERDRDADRAKAGATSGRGGRGARDGGRGAGPAGERPAAGAAPPIEAAPVTTEDPTPEEAVEPATVAEVGEAASDFVRGLVDAFGVDGRTSVAELDVDTIEVRVEGSDLGLLVGSKGTTLGAIQDLTRTVITRVEPGGRNVRVHVDVAGYRARRREALERFTRQVAESVKETGRATAMEPMNAADRKVVHDTANAIDGIRTTSEGEEPRRRVVLHAEDDAGA
jgi:spoIIIJ-associated protein